MDIPDWWREATTVSLAAAVYNRSRSLIHQLVQKYEIRTFHLGNVVYVNRPDLEKMIYDLTARETRSGG